MRNGKNHIILMLIMVSLLLFSGCGKKQKEPLDKEATEVLKLTITPAPSPTPMPAETYPKAVIEKDGVTFVNQYILDDARASGKLNEVPAVTPTVSASPS